MSCNYSEIDIAFFIIAVFNLPPSSIATFIIATFIMELDELSIDGLIFPIVTSKGKKLAGISLLESLVHAEQ